MTPSLNGRLDPYVLPDFPDLLIVPRTGCAECDARALARLERKGYASRLETEAEQEEREFG